MTTLKRLTAMIMITFTLGGGLVSLPPENVQAKTAYVYIAPNHGKKYHFTSNCRGLNRAKRIKHVKLSWAKRHGYKRCKLG
ncbi:hypothetical protein [Lactiplantibacillus mudanjiangensis]|uniref:Uncharacterized protein n=1 Tax=Lactiplantibacillus mudanjiangensis TaxID=1296538 RepID=A0A660DZS2_9LACO|nr:hypothetical protein [Lactiplantibacillus mudanjiangensis]VDG20559.1 hypothetical protein [Lactobacillus buchneri CD034] [Lactiplantibacillus mudanjiangensis]VDG24549.1 hypothetical protein [Lactobacillus buchneri CD034] [Lactiplantibacillus mudanjiangensis]VDG28598.1 hypothetical protein [Lactobacillus buchneri CD034] [Lactiplantibacillus mudanjiangensis]VDG30703.1 hypothetical protein [Lactobacillus buchneri CD034] [Lactiplantibacillus mudanjiangensis]